MFPFPYLFKKKRTQEITQSRSRNDYAGGNIKLPFLCIHPYAFHVLMSGDSDMCFLSSAVSYHSCFLKRAQTFI